MQLMAIATISTRSFFLQSHHHRQQGFAITTTTTRNYSLFSTPSLSFTVFTCSTNRNKLFHPAIVFSSSGNGGNFSGGTGGGSNGGGGGGDGDHHDDHDRSHNRSEAILALAEVGRTLESLPKDLAEAIKAGRLPGSIVCRYCVGEVANVPMVA